MDTSTRDDGRLTLSKITQHAQYLRAHSTDATTNAAALSITRLVRGLEAQMVETEAPAEVA